VSEDRPKPVPGQPFTVGGVAGFAHARIGRLLLASMIFGVLTGLAVMFLGARGWAPALDEVVAALPETGAIQNGSLRWPERSGRLLGANRFLSLEVVLNDAPRESASADLSIEVHPTYFLFRSVLGAMTLPYPAMFNLALDRPTAVPAWGAWRMPALVALVPMTAVLLIVTWSALAIPYTLFALPIGALFRRDLSFRSAWKLCVAAQLPGSLLMTFALALYASGQVSVLFVIIMLVAHFIPTVLYILCAPLLAPKRAPIGPPGKNPFNKSERAGTRVKNPFAGSQS
jgi:hypothetical protein